MAEKATVAEDPRGLKRICTSCGVRFYDLNKRPIICPSCETEFTGEIKVKTRRSRAAIATEALEEEKAAQEKKAANDKTEDDDEVETDVDIVSLDDAAEAESKDEDGDEDVADADLDLDGLEGDDDLDSDDDLDGLEGDVVIDKNAGKDE